MLFHKIPDIYHDFVVERDKRLCIDCGVCVGQCSYGAHCVDTERVAISHDNSKCVGCHRCAALCPSGALSVKSNDMYLGRNGAGTAVHLRNIYKQAEYGKKLHAGNNPHLDIPVYWDKLLLNYVTEVSEETRCLSESPLLFDTKPSSPINPNLYTAMKIAVEQLEAADKSVSKISFESCSSKHCRIIASNNVAELALAAANSGETTIVIDAERAVSGPFSTSMQHVVIPVEIAISVVDRKLRDEGVRDKISIIAAGGIRCSSDVVKAVALGADSVYIGTAIMVAVGCSLCGRCYTGKCPWGIATTYSILCKRQNPELAAERMANLVTVWNQELADALWALGLADVVELRGNRDVIRAVGMSETEMNIFGVKYSGQ